jgi:hypothetical protein
MKINWDILAVVVSLLVIIVGWGVSVELRMAQHSTIQSIEASVVSVKGSIDALATRVQNIEKLLTPVIVDHRVQKELERLKAEGLKGMDTEIRPSMIMPLPSPPPAPAPVAPRKASPQISGSKKEDATDPMAEARKRAEVWAENAIQEGQQRRPAGK